MCGLSYKEDLKPNSKYILDHGKEEDLQAHGEATEQEEELTASKTKTKIMIELVTL